MSYRIVDLELEEEVHWQERYLADPTVRYRRNPVRSGINVALKPPKDLWPTIAEAREAIAKSDMHGYSKVIIFYPLAEAAQMYLDELDQVLTVYPTRTTINAPRWRLARNILVDFMGWRDADLPEEMFENGAN